MSDSDRQRQGRALLGNGLAGRAADDMRLAPIYRQAQIDAAESGKDLPPYEEWKKQYLSQAESDMQAGFDSIRK